MRKHSNLMVGMTRCEHLHLVGFGCSEDSFDPDCEDCPFNQKEIRACSQMDKASAYEAEDFGGSSPSRRS